MFDLGAASGNGSMIALPSSNKNGRSQTHVANIHSFLIKGVSSCSSPPGLAPSGIERPEWVAVPAPYVTVRWPVVGDVCARQSMRSTCFQIRGAANVRHAFEVRLSSQRSSRDRRAKMAATNSLGRSRRGDDMAGSMHKSRRRRFARTGAPLSLQGCGI